jgi:hypothetical protein
MKMPGPYVDMKISTSRGNCENMKRVSDWKTSTQNKWNGITSIIPSNITRRAAQKATIIAAIEMTSVERPIINFLGKDIRKSCSA